MRFNQTLTMPSMKKYIFFFFFLKKWLIQPAGLLLVPALNQCKSELLKKFKPRKHKAVPEVDVLSVPVPEVGFEM